jgi:GntR family transcriptional regulator
MSIDFKSSKGIFQQIADALSHRILDGKLKAGERVPSMRDLAEEFEVSRNTLLRTFALLNDAGIIENKRGLGFFVAADAVRRIRLREKKFFFINELPEFISKVQRLKLTADDLSELIHVIEKNTIYENEH